MSTLLNPLVYTFQWSLQPIAPFTWFGLGITTLDVVAAARLCLGLRQLRESVYAEYVSKKGDNEIEKSFVKDLSTTLTVTYGGEAMAGDFLFVPCRVCVLIALRLKYVASLLGLTPSFMMSGVIPTLYAVIHATIESLPAVPAQSLQSELFLSVVDGFTRSFLLCNFTPPIVTAHASPLIANSPWTLLLASLVCDMAHLTDVILHIHYKRNSWQLLFRLLLMADSS